MLAFIARVIVLLSLLALTGCRAPDARSHRPGALTFNKDIAPLLFEHCGGCHRPGQPAPFSVLNYEDVRQHARQIAAVTKSRAMPPWLPEPGYGEFINQRRLRGDQIDRIQQWVRKGAVEGDPADLPPTPNPHAHYLARDMKGFATLPDGTVKWLIWIKNWNFNWQDQYRYATPLFLPKGTVVTMQYTYDNSAGNVRNPHHPPRRVAYGPQSSDEMGDLWLQVLPRSSDDVRILVGDYVEREVRADIASGEMMVTLTPRDAGRRNFLAARYLQVGRVQEAIAHLEEALRLRPRYAEAHNNLGNALQSQGKLADCVRKRFTTCVRASRLALDKQWLTPR